MRKYLVNGFMALAALTATSCIKSDYQFGNDMLDGGMKMETHIDTFYMTKTYQCAMDSFPSSTSGVCTIGQWHSDSTGTCTVGAVFNYVPMGFEEDTFFGYGAVADSMKITLNLVSTRGWGDSTTSMRVKVYRLRDFCMHEDSSYYSNFPIEKYIDPTPMVTITTREFNADTSITVSFPEWYAKLHFDNRQDTDNIYVRDRKFISRINGLYCTAEPVNPGESRLLDLGLGSSNLRLYYHNDTYPDSLLYQSYILYNTSLSTCLSNFVTIRSDFTTAKPEIGGLDYRTINDTIEPLDRVFVSCPCDLYSRIDFDTTKILTLWDKAKEAGYKYVGIQGAELRLNLVHTDYKTLDKAITPLKLYISIQHPKFLSEYNPLYTSSSEYNTIGGNLIRSLGYYSFNITGYIQRLVNRAAYSTHLDIFPPYSSGLNWGTSYIAGSEDAELQPELIVTYTFVEKE